MVSSTPMPMSSASLSFVPNQSIALSFSAGYSARMSIIRSPTSSTGDRHDRRNAVSASATARATRATTMPA